jgi:hypothetical protein
LHLSCDQISERRPAAAIRHLHQADVGNILRTRRSARLNFGVLSDAIHALKIPKAAVAYQREHGALWVRDEALVAHLRRASADGALRRCGAVSGRLFSAFSAQPNQVGTSGDISGTGRAPLGFDSGMFRRSEATSLPASNRCWHGSTSTTIRHRPTHSLCTWVLTQNFTTIPARFYDHIGLLSRQSEEVVG